MNGLPIQSIESAPELSPTFSLSQSSLQMFQDCTRRFWLTHIARLPWPALEAAPILEHESIMRQGAAFHRLVERAINQIPVDAEALEAPLHGWFRDWLAAGREGLPTTHLLTEHTLSIPLRAALGAGDDEEEQVLAGQTLQLVAKYDLIAAEPEGRVVIMDWKTSARRGDPAHLRARLQSIVYPFVLVEASHALPFGPVRPEQVEMRYWFGAAPEQPVVLRYDGYQHDHNRQLLRDMLANILSRNGEGEFHKVADTPENRKRFCNYCIYRSRCERGSRPGLLDDVAPDEGVDPADIDETLLDYAIESVTELAF